MIELSPDQQIALDQLLNWLAKPTSPFITLGGYAGSGKSTLISILRNELFKRNSSLQVAFCSFTGKAARVLRNKLQEQQAIRAQDSIGTIHSLIYAPVVDKDEQIVGWERKQELKADLIIVDEASMVDQAIWQDLLSYRVPIIAVGDHGQLPPINASFNLMQVPQIKLEHIHRQASENPIIQLSQIVREQGTIPYGTYGNQVKILQKGSPESQEQAGELLANYKNDLLVLCGYNTTRVRLNKYIRSALEFESPLPQVRDRVICLRNNHTKQVYNGMLGTVRQINHEDTWHFAEIEMDGEDKNYSGKIAAEQFDSAASLNFTSQRKRSVDIDLFDFGYALTVHKAQGSQSPKVLLFAEKFKQMDEDTWKRWLYTAITRAEEQLWVVL
jgi:exodeoxyribonuclease-5